MSMTIRPRWSLGSGKTLVPSCWQATELVEVRLSPLYLVLADGALTREFERLRHALPPVPGRASVLRRAQTTALALTQRYLANDGAKATPIPLTLVLRDKKKTKTVQGGVVSALPLVALPEARDVLIRTAQARNVLVIDTSPPIEASDRKAKLPESGKSAFEGGS